MPFFFNATRDELLLPLRAVCSFGPFAVPVTCDVVSRLFHFLPALRAAGGGAAARRSLKGLGVLGVGA